MSITITIECENSAFEGSNCGTEVARILHKLANKWHSYKAEELYDVRLLDENGNSVGEMKVTE